MQKTIIGRNQAGQRLDKFLAKYLPGAAKSFLYKMLRKKNITLNGKKASGSEILSENDSVESFFSDETFKKFSSEPISNDSSKTGKAAEKDIFRPVKIYSDPDIIIFDKPAGMLSQKAEKNDYSLNEYLVDFCLDNRVIIAEDLKTFKPSICNRLDRNTSGLVLCGCSLKGLQILTEIIKGRRIEKYYLTVCHGRIDKSFTSKGYLIKDEKSNTVSIINKDITDKGLSTEELKGVYIETDFKPIENYGNKATLLEVKLHTGKSHQIRAQLSALGHPIYGDKKYISLNGNRNFGNEPEEKKLKYQLLQAYKVIFPKDFPLISDSEFKKDDNTIELSRSKEISKLISLLVNQGENNG